MPRAARRGLLLTFALAATGAARPAVAESASAPATAPASGDMTELRWTLSQGAKAFAATVAPQCFLSPDASIDADGNILTVHEQAPCAGELRSLSKAWVEHSGEAVVTLTGSPEALLAARERLEKRYGRSPNPRLRFLTETQHCRCLVMSGAQSLEAADASGLAGVAGAGASAPRTATRPDKRHDRLYGTDPLLQPPGARGPGAADQGLIWQTDQAPAGTTDTAPLIN